MKDIHPCDSDGKFITNACLKKFDQLLVKSHLDNCKSLDRDLPVGENLQDHYGTGALTFTVDQVGLFWQQCYDRVGFSCSS